MSTHPDQADTGNPKEKDIVSIHPREFSKKPQKQQWKGKKREQIEPRDKHKPDDKSNIPTDS